MSRRLLLFVWCAPILGYLCATEPPVALTAGGLQLVCPSPEAAAIAYRGTRFVPASLGAEIHWHGRTVNADFTHPNFPETNTAGGFAEEFDDGGLSIPADFQPVAGSTFCKIGIGLLVADGKPYVGWRTYPISQLGAWSGMRTADGYAYEWRTPPTAAIALVYRRTLSFSASGGTLIVAHQLENHGSKVLATSHYAHNFLGMDKQPLDEGCSLFISGGGLADSCPAPLRFDGSILAIMHTPLWPAIGGVGCDIRPPPRADDDWGRTIRFRARPVGLELAITCDRRPDRVRIYATSHALCPEQHLLLSVKPGGQTRWASTYAFSQLSQE